MDGVSQVHTTALTKHLDLNDPTNATFTTAIASGNDDFSQTSSLISDIATYSPLNSARGIQSELLTAQCRLPAKDPWNKEILPYLNPLDPGPVAKCKLKFEEVTQFDYAQGLDGVQHLSIRDKFVTNVKRCDYRCLTPVSDHKFKTGKWTQLKDPVQPRCDVFEGRNEDQLKDPSQPPLQANNSGFGVQIIVLDSVSRSQFHRAMQKTVYLLREEMNAISFDYLNKVGENSKPNGCAFLMGRQVRTIPRSPINSKAEPADKGQAGYKTMMAEDWAAGVFNWPNCKGFTTTPMDHYMKRYFWPFQLRLTQKAGKGKEFVYENFNGKRCLEAHSHLLDYFRQFVEVYDDVSKKFSVIWMSDLAHNHPNHLYHADHFFYQLFRGLQSKLDNTFLFVMGDHGNRFGKLRATATGTMEDNNPALFVVLPRQLRHNSALRAVLESNAKQLISHYDLYATLVEISQMQRDWDENYRPKQEGQHGLSLLHKLQPRNCPSLKIPFDYCQCEWNYTEITSDQLADKLVWAAVDKLNQDLPMQI
uniref:Uncharacterized protein n=1 Tax=Ditylenchus dipsaci TaxID=166011 RepID=A0A915E0G2_9BILA